VAGLLMLVLALWLVGSAPQSAAPPQEAPPAGDAPASLSAAIPAIPATPPVPTVTSWPPATAGQQADDLARLLALAERHQVQWPGADYRLAPAPGPASAPAGADALVWQIDVPLRGKATELESFVQAVPHELPHARVDRLALARAASAPDTLQADARLNLHYRRTSP
jgi:hypothetical protein